ncbi:hypothetical protein SAMN04490205_3314 [Pseudomonas trivialis]|uniref:Lipoprotein n=1 Tax=Pseudomonas trivialis TaxID=200450 RepID=A0ABY0UHP9_9PSED|nr:hypothetical protein SAMN04490205_3314 [Pseudomonas trivialis]
MPNLTWAAWLVVIGFVAVFLACSWGISQSV